MEVWDYLCRLSLCNTGIIRVQHNKHMLGKLTNQLLFFLRKKICKQYFHRSVHLSRVLGEMNHHELVHFSYTTG